MTAGSGEAGEASEVTAGGLTVAVAGEELAHAQTEQVERAAAAGVPAALAAKDPTLWGPEAAAEAAIRLGWLDLPQSSRELLPRLDDLAGRLSEAGLDHVVLAGMGGSSLAPEVITATAGVDLTVLDTTDPHQVRRVLGDRLDRTVVVVSSKSGTTVETDSHRLIYERALRDAGFTDAEIARRFVIVTDPGSPLEDLANAAGYHVVLADPDVGGRYSALTAFGLVPSALAGADVRALLDEAAALGPALSNSSGNPGLALGAVLGAAALARRDKVVLTGGESSIPGFGDWAEQLLAESTGKQGSGLLPVVLGDPHEPRPAGADTHLVSLDAPAGAAPATAVSGALGAQFLAWEYATAVAGNILGINPFDQPNVQESKENTKKLLADAGDGELPVTEPVFVDGPVEVHTAHELLDGARDLADVMEVLLETLPDEGYLAVMAYLDRHGDADAAQLRSALGGRTERPVTFGWGPRFLHSTGQYHKGGPQQGVFLQLTGAVTEDVEVPGQPYTLGRLQLAQALGDLNALGSRGRPVVRLHLRDRGGGLARVLDAARGGSE